MMIRARKQGTGMFRRILCLLAALFLTAGYACAARAEVYIEQEKPADWEERELLRIYALYALDCDSFVLECGGQVMVLDGGNSPKEKDLTDFLKEHGWEHPDMIFNSHPHDDHIEALYNAIRHGGISTDVFISPFREDYSYRFQKNAVKALREKEIPYRQIFNGEELTLGGARMVMYRYDGDTKKPDHGSMTMNDMSGVLWVRYGDAAILLTADIGGMIQKMLADQYGSEGLKSDILKAPHHGKNAVNGDLLKTVNPKLVIITGKVARTEDCLRQMNREKIAWKRTSYGTILMETDGKDWYVNQEYPSEQVKKQEKKEQKKK